SVPACGHRRGAVGVPHPRWKLWRPGRTDRCLSVPGDLALCCFDDFAWADLFSPRLTAVAQPSRDIGAQAVRLLLDRLAEPDRPARTLRLPCTFVHRGSCGCVEQPGPLSEKSGHVAGPSGKAHAKAHERTLP
ncbi:substrate-binding domain-containing protein, partial [Streptomyces violaceoruber]